MPSAQAIPVLIGVGKILQRLEDPREAAEPLAIMVAALEIRARLASEPLSAPTWVLSTRES